MQARTHRMLAATGAFACAAMLATLAAAAIAAEPVVYPARGQTPLQQEKDRYECHEWARAQSGFDPARPATQQAAAGTAAANPGPSSQDKTAAMARGALTGASVAELTHHDAGRGAAIGVMSTAAMGRMREQARQEQAAQQRTQQQQQQAARTQQQAAHYERSLAACLEGRGYVVR